MSFATDLLTSDEDNSFEVINTNLTPEVKNKLSEIFPERGFQRYFPNWLIKVFLEYLEQEKITNLTSRINHVQFQSIEDILRDFKTKSLNNE